MKSRDKRFNGAMNPISHRKASAASNQRPHSALEQLGLPVLRWALAAAFVWFGLLPLFIVPTAWLSNVPPEFAQQSQYVVKNFVLVAVALAIASRVQPMSAAAKSSRNPQASSGAAPMSAT